MASPTPRNMTRVVPPFDPGHVLSDTIPARMTFMSLELRALDSSLPAGEQEVMVIGLNPGTAKAVVIRRNGELSLTEMSHLTAEIHFDPDKNAWVYDWPAFLEEEPLFGQWDEEENDDDQKLDTDEDETDGSSSLPGSDDPVD